MQESWLAYTPVSCRCTRYAYIRASLAPLPARVSIKLPPPLPPPLDPPAFFESRINAKFIRSSSPSFQIPRPARDSGNSLRIRMRGTYKREYRVHPPPPPSPSTRSKRKFDRMRLLDFLRAKNRRKGRGGERRSSVTRSVRSTSSLNVIRVSSLQYR